MEHSVNQRVKELRELLKLTQSEFASHINKSSSMIGKIENNETTVTKGTISAIEDAFRIVTGWLENGIGYPYSDMLAENETRVAEMKLELRERAKTGGGSNNALLEKALNELSTQLKMERERVNTLMQIIANVTGGGGGAVKHNLANQAGFLRLIKGGKKTVSEVKVRVA